jgi:hypothetical protein
MVVWISLWYRLTHLHANLFPRFASPFLESWCFLMRYFKQSHCSKGSSDMLKFCGISRHCKSLFQNSCAEFESSSGGLSTHHRFRNLQSLDSYGYCSKIRRFVNGKIWEQRNLSKNPNRLKSRPIVRPSNHTADCAYIHHLRLFIYLFVHSSNSFFRLVLVYLTTPSVAQRKACRSKRLWPNFYFLLLFSK